MSTNPWIVYTILFIAFHRSLYTCLASGHMHSQQHCHVKTATPWANSQLPTTQTNITLTDTANTQALSGLPTSDLAHVLQCGGAIWARAHFPVRRQQQQQQQASGKGQRANGKWQERGKWQDGNGDGNTDKDVVRVLGWLR